MLLNGRKCLGMDLDIYCVYMLYFEYNQCLLYILVYILHKDFQYIQEDNYKNQLNCVLYIQHWGHMVKEYKVLVFLQSANLEVYNL